MKRQQSISGTFKPPKDLAPAIAGLGDKGKRYLDDLVLMNDGQIKHWMIAQAMDYERGESQI
jgi:hypothetical protein